MYNDNYSGFDFARGYPSESLLPESIMQQASNHLIEKGSGVFLQYGTSLGSTHFRRILADFLSQQYGTPVVADELMVTGGASQGLDLICTLLARPGDTIFVEEPSYFLVFRIFKDHHLNIVSIPTDENGLIIEELEAKLQEHRPVFVYTIPIFHNPSGVTMSQDRRQRLVDLSVQHNFKIIADEVYQLLNYSITPPPPLRCYDQSGTVLSLGSFSKILAPGLRLGWLQTSPSIIEHLSESGVLKSGGGVNHFTSGWVQSVLETGIQATHLKALKKTYGERAARLGQALQNHLPPCVTFHWPQGGYFVWLRLPEHAEAEAILKKVSHCITFHPGNRFSTTGGLTNYIRLSFSYQNADKLEEGAQQLGEILTKELVSHKP